MIVFCLAAIILVALLYRIAAVSGGLPVLLEAIRDMVRE